ncbi:hypothetical protein MRX96_005434 [Rhipicephalus microplus]
MVRGTSNAQSGRHEGMCVITVKQKQLTFAGAAKVFAQLQLPSEQFGRFKHCMDVSTSLLLSPRSVSMKAPVKATAIAVSRNPTACMAYPALQARCKT